jgi:hypothetical protein
LSTLKDADNVFGFTARHPFSPATLIVVGVTAAVTFMISGRTVIRWVLPLACGAAFLAVALTAGSDGIPEVSPHRSLTAYATGDRHALPMDALEALVKHSETMAATRERLVPFCASGTDSRCLAALTAEMIPRSERYRATLRTVAHGLAPSSRCLRGLDAHDAAIARQQHSARAILVAALDRDYEAAGKLQRGSFAARSRELQTAGMDDMEHCLPASLR